MEEPGRLHGVAKSWTGLSDFIQTNTPGNKLTQKESMDSGMMLITLAGPRQSILFAGYKQVKQLVLIPEENMGCSSFTHAPPPPLRIHLGWLSSGPALSLICAPRATHQAAGYNVSAASV